MFEICSLEKCTGCGLCVAICPKSAVELNLTNLHRFPNIDKDKCIHCNRCKIMCPANNNPQVHSSLECYVAWCKNQEEHKVSSSGGVATILSRKVLQDGGYVCGSIYKDLSVTSKLTNKEDDLLLFRGSKYVHNYFEKQTYSDIIKKLRENEIVLFIGIPCQCDAIRRISGNPNNLIIAELLCLGGASPELFKKHLINKCGSRVNKIKNITFRGGLADYYLCASNECDELLYAGYIFEDPYFYSFSKHYLFRDACYRCKYAKQERVGDLTIADFWGIDPNFLKEKDCKFGYNLVLINTEKGRNLFNSINEDVFSYKRNILEAIHGNKTLNAPTKRPIFTDKIIKLEKLIGLWGALVLSDKEYRRRIMCIYKEKIILEVKKISNSLYC